jgi:anaerobic magnesium-protoporphyrin IX monomethyl ester cyclase
LNKIRVLLLNPPTAAESTEPLLGLGYLAAVLREKGHEVKIIDATAPFKRLSPKDVETAVLDFSPHFIGITLTIDYIPDTYDYIEGLRKLKYPIIVGGPHVNPLPEEALENGADIVALGEGEVTVVELADYFAGNGTRIEDIKGLCYKKDNGDLYRAATRPLINNIDEIPFPSFEDFPIRNYTGSDDPDSNPIFWSLFSSRGCPFNCIFCCGHNVFGRSYRMRSAENIFEEIGQLHNKYGASKFAFQDDEVMINRQRIIKLCELILSSNIKIKISVRSRIDSLDAELLKICKAAGFNRISFGIESWNDDSLTKMNKKYKVKDIEKGIRQLVEANYSNINVNNIVGFPWETREHYKKNLEVISSIPDSIAYFTTVSTPIPYPNTELYNMYHKEYGFTNWWLKHEMHWQHWTLFSTGNYRPIFYRIARKLLVFYSPDLYWKYSQDQLADIEYFSWRLLWFFCRKHYNFFMSKTIVLLCRLSVRLWKISPLIEKNLLGSILRKFVDAVEKKLSFTNVG